MRRLRTLITVTLTACAALMPIAASAAIDPGTAVAVGQAAAPAVGTALNLIGALVGGLFGLVFGVIKFILIVIVTIVLVPFGMLAESPPEDAGQVLPAAVEPASADIWLTT